MMHGGIGPTSGSPFPQVRELEPRARVNTRDVLLCLCPCPCPYVCLEQKTMHAIARAYAVRWSVTHGVARYRSTYRRARAQRRRGAQRELQLRHRLLEIQAQLGVRSYCEVASLQPTTGRGGAALLEQPDHAGNGRRGATHPMRLQGGGAVPQAPERRRGRWRPQAQVQVRAAAACR